MADNGKKSKVAERGQEDSDHIDGELVLSIEKLQEIQDELEKVMLLQISCFFFFFLVVLLLNGGFIWRWFFGRVFCSSLSSAIARFSYLYGRELLLRIFNVCSLLLGC